MCGCGNQLSKNLDAVLQPRQLRFVQLFDGASERLHAPGASLNHNALALGSGDDSGQAPIVRVSLSFDQTVLLESRYDLGHCRRSYLLGAREMAERDGSTKDDHRQRGKAWRRESGGVVFLAQLAKQVNSGGVQLVCQLRPATSPRPH